jgi:hypothetical protein
MEQLIDDVVFVFPATAEWEATHITREQAERKARQCFSKALYEETKGNKPEAEHWWFKCLEWEARSNAPAIDTGRVP